MAVTCRNLCPQADKKLGSVELIPDDIVHQSNALVIRNVRFISFYVHSFIASLMPNRAFFTRFVPPPSCPHAADPISDRAAQNVPDSEGTRTPSLFGVLDRNSSLWLKWLGAKLIKNF